MKEREKFLLQFRCQIDEQVAATYKGEFGKGRIHDDVLRGKNDHLTDGFCHLIPALHLDEEALQPFRRNVGGDIG